MFLFRVLCKVCNDFFSSKHLSSICDAYTRYRYEQRVYSRCLVVCLSYVDIESQLINIGSYGFHHIA